MMRLGTFRRLAACMGGSMAIETALVAPILATLSIGAFEASTIVARQHELQSAASEAETIAMTASGGVETDLSTIKDILEDSVNLAADDITVVTKFRCNTDEQLLDPDQDGNNPCAEDAVVSTYLELSMTDTYSPVWRQFGIGSDIEYNVVRMIQVA